MSKNAVGQPGGLNAMQTHSAKPNKALAFVVGAVMALIGLWVVVDSVPQFEQFAVRQRITYGYQPGNGMPLPDGRYAHTVSGFQVGATALFGAVLFSLGAGIAASPLFNAEGHRRLSLWLALSWHATGITTGICFLEQAPRPLSFEPLLTISLFEWLGLFPLALGISKDWLNGRLNSAVWSMWFGAIPGMVAVGLLGYVIDLVRFRVLRIPVEGVFATPFWMFGIMAGGATAGVGFFVYGWRFSAGRKTHQE